MVDATRWFGACGYAYLRWIAAHHGAPDVVRTLVPRDTEMRAVVPRLEPVRARPISMQRYFIIPSSGRSLPSL